MACRAGLLLALAALAACGGDDAPAPPEVLYGLEECGFCRMIVSEKEHAAAIVDEAGAAVAFDDPGCLLHHLHEQPGAAGGRVWVHDHAGGGWIDAGAASFVRDPESATPMGSGLLAFAERTEADAFARGRGLEVRTWAELTAKPSAR